MAKGMIMDKEWIWNRDRSGIERICNRGPSGRGEVGDHLDQETILISMSAATQLNGFNKPSGS